MEDYKITG
jgi:hypothetical protein